jgi:hypothetical protein
VQVLRIVVGDVISNAEWKYFCMNCVIKRVILEQVHIEIVEITFITIVNKC